MREDGRQETEDGRENSNAAGAGVARRTRGWGSRKSAEAQSGKREDRSGEPEIRIQAFLALTPGGEVRRPGASCWEAQKKMLY